ncbi:hypothetical protein TWF506_006605 [Arthrobotrys conoides]|uniref:Uncharacterized protein n=1 Tax=Arthrobotrys conoides TaxID=74498 RepID=A0AAN8NRL1_9PEZI
MEHPLTHGNSEEKVHDLQIEPGHGQTEVSQYKSLAEAPTNLIPESNARAYNATATKINDTILSSHDS